jgi:hypothetical protein
MSTQSWSTRIRHDSDAVFREWGAEFAAKLLAAGLTQTADTGQINWVTVTRAGASANAGYEIWRFNDTLQATAPIFIRIDYGTGSNTSAPRINITVGTGSNGSGTLTGTALTAANSTANGNAVQSSDTLRNSYLNYNATLGFFGFNWKQAGTASVEAYFMLERTKDSSGLPTATGALVLWGNAATGFAAQSLRFASTAAAYTLRTSIVTAQLCAWPMTPTSSLVGSDTQVALCFTITPRVEPVLSIVGCLNAEYTTGNTFTATMIGSTARTYIALTNTFFVDSNSTLKAAMLWE